MPKTSSIHSAVSIQYWLVMDGQTDTGPQLTLIRSSYVHEIIERRSSLNGEQHPVTCLSLVDSVMLRSVMKTQTQRVRAFFLLVAYPTDEAVVDSNFAPRCPLLSHFEYLSLKMRVAKRAVFLVGEKEVA